MDFVYLEGKQTQPAKQLEALQFWRRLCPLMMRATNRVKIFQHFASMPLS